jgi:tetratricopeptide (TPR) repeat protein
MAASSPAPRLTGPRRVLFPLAAAVLVPAVLLAVLELALRLLGSGTEPRFFVTVPDSSSPMVTTNPRFGWRFFPPEIARGPVVSRFADPKPEGTFRVFVLGGSAALGTPDAAFGLGRVLEAMLQESFPERPVEVINAALTAINSHGVRLIAREAARYEPDLFVVYLGNNEVVGPYGPGTVFSGFGRSRTLIRASLALRATRIGQLAARVTTRISGEELESWRGMEMFLAHRVPATDPRLGAVYRHFAANLEDIVTAGRRAGAAVIVSTVATNLVDNPPFAAVSDPGLGEAERASLERLVTGSRALAAVPGPESLETLQALVDLDPGHAGSRYLLGRALLSAGRIGEAAEHLTAARDLDALRFRADSAVQEVLRRVAGGREDQGVFLVDGERAVAGAAPGEPPLPGGETLWEHVHLTFAGNYRLAEAIYARAAPLVARGAVVPPPPTAERCAARLALTAWDRERMAREILAMVSRPPFSDQPGQAERLRSLRRQLHRLAVMTVRDGTATEESDRAVLRERPDDLAVRAQRAAYLEERGRPREAAEEWGELLSRVPGVLEWRTRRAFSWLDVARAGGDDRPDFLTRAEQEARAVLQAQPGPGAQVNLAVVLAARGRHAEADAIYRQVRRKAPHHRAAGLNWAELPAAWGDLGEAERRYGVLLAEEPSWAEALARLGAVLERRQDLVGALAHYRRAVAADPGLAWVQNNLGHVLEQLDHRDEAVEAYSAALAADPTYPLPYFNLADLHLAAGHHEAAAELYRAGLELDPGNRQGWFNLGLALAGSGRTGEAAAARRRAEGR